MDSNLVEIFSSVQGEGPSVGESTLFIRFAGCDLRCSWCDSPHTWKPSQSCRIEKQRGSGKFLQVENPVSMNLVLDAAKNLSASSHRWISLTGGEPLLQKSLPEMASALKALGTKVQLETHGLEFRRLAEVLTSLDAISMDWKLSKDVKVAGGPQPVSFSPLHERFLGLAQAVGLLTVKVVITPWTTKSEIEEISLSVAKIAPNATLVLQPVTPSGTVHNAPAAELLLSLARLAETFVQNVRVIPQTHKSYGAL